MHRMRLDFLPTGHRRGASSDGTSDIQDPSPTEENDEDVILVGPSSSEDELEPEPPNEASEQHSIQGAHTQSIKHFLLEAKRLLRCADDQSRSEERQNSVSGHLYDFSRHVTAEDLLREREFTDMLSLVARLKGRLSAERVFSLGCPHLRRERDIFDELLLLHSAELLEGSERTAHVSSDVASASNTDLSLPGPSNSVVETTESNRNISSEVLNPNVSDQRTLTVSEGITNVPSGISTMPSAHSREELTENSETSASSFISAAGSVLSEDSSGSRVNFNGLENQMQHVRESLKQFLLSGTMDLSPTVNVQNVLRYLEMSSALIPSCSSASTMENLVQSPRSRKRKKPEDEVAANDSKEEEKMDSNDKKTKVEEEDEEEESCPICLEPWSTGGEHRITCLKCGHLFGLSCIEKWVDQARCCPHCKAPAKKSDIRPIFVKKVTAEDTSQRDRALRLLEEEKFSRRQMEQKEASTRKELSGKIASMEAEMVLLQARLQRGEVVGAVSSGSSSVISSTPGSVRYGSSRFAFQEKINLSQEPSCRVFDVCPTLGMTVVSLKSPNTLFRGFGIKILSRDFRHLSYQPLHANMIRDLCFQPGSLDGMLLSGGMDKCVQLTSLTSKTVVQKYTLNSTVWSCSWNLQNTNLFYAGMERGVVKEFDIRRTDAPVADILDNGGSPVTCLQYLSGQETERGLHGLLIGHQQNLVFREQNGEDVLTHRLPSPQAPLMSLSLYPNGKFLTSFRPGTSLTSCRHEISQLVHLPSEVEGMPHSVTSVRAASWDIGNSQTVISRNSLIPHPEEDSSLLAVVANHSENKINILDLKKKEEVQSLVSHGQRILDIKPVPGITGSFLALAGKDLFLYKWR
ncbi:E3 ubiquitin-protein ligase RFWD3 [Aplysia californica]|uniref:RING-type E3 ubiquitin transferase n=1 Tax=Aplysia californica TaxID=6500 RepID=A0ABM1AAA8_APLCA|nr:E3 ubiquitin-protein ligase RFWD3 [Aplysia californica]XP_012943870.1 E3 ubiquitin-protein ligase RFWD3 [Aplysia californica]